MCFFSLGTFKLACCPFVFSPQPFLGCIHIYCQGQFILDPAGRFIPEAFYTMASLIAHGSIYQGNTDEKTPPPLLPPPSFLSLLPSAILD